MYLSRIEINRRRRDTMRALASPQIIHGAIEACFPARDKSDSRSLWRIDQFNGLLYLLLQSGIKPDFTHIAEQFGWPGQTWETREYDGFLSRLKNEQVWRFRLLANPTHSVNVEGKSRGKVMGHATVAWQKNWLSTRAEKHGFALEQADGLPTFDVVQSDIRRFLRCGSPVIFNAVTFEGVLRVIDAELLVNSMTHGIGREKAYGCGLLTLAR
jgi:CRISPR system Cascade subunit CasE